jgi:hypothetical protein
MSNWIYIRKEATWSKSRAINLEKVMMIEILSVSYTDYEVSISLPEKTVKGWINHEDLEGLGINTELLLREIVD